MAIEIGPQPKAKKTSLTDVIFYVALILLVMLVAGFFILNAWQKKLDVQLAEIKKSLERTDEEKALEEEIFGSPNKVGLQQEIQDFSSLVDSQKLPLNVFNFLQESTHPRVWFQRFGLDVQQGSLSLSGFAESLEALNQQIMIFRSQEIIRDANLAQMSFTQDGDVSFDFQLTLDPKIFNSSEIPTP
jgi:Tfp pilus assembly protein PilN